MAEQITEESNILIAERQAPGDRWRLVHYPKIGVIDGLVEALTQYMRNSGEKVNYRLEPLNGKLFAIKEETYVVEPPKPKVFDLYGEGLND